VGTLSVHKEPSIGTRLMRILTAENQTFELDELPEEIDDMRFAVLDNSDPTDPDYFFIPLIFLESFNAPALVMKVGNRHIRMPVDWQILIGEPDFGDLEVVPLTSVNDRGFKAFTFNPIGNKTPEYHPIELADVYTEVRWFFPKLKPGQLLAIPLEDGDSPDCVFFVKDITRQCEVVDISKVW